MLGRDQNEEKSFLVHRIPQLHVPKESNHDRRELQPTKASRGKQKIEALEVPPSEKAYEGVSVLGIPEEGI